jgi:hypothetical protein
MHIPLTYTPSVLHPIVEVEDLLKEIIKYLPENDLFAFELTSKKFEILSNSNELWYKLAKMDRPFEKETKYKKYFATIIPTKSSDFIFEYAASSRSMVS